MKSLFFDNYVNLTNLFNKNIVFIRLVNRNQLATKSFVYSLKQLTKNSIF